MLPHLVSESVEEQIIYDQILYADCVTEEGASSSHHSGFISHMTLATLCAAWIHMLASVTWEIVFLLLL